MISKLTKKDIVTALTWVIISVSLGVIGIHFISCSREISGIVQDQHNEEISQLIELQSNIPPVSNESMSIVTIKQKKNKDTVSTGNRPIVTPCGVDSLRVSKAPGGVISLHCGGNTVGSLFIKPGTITKDTTIKITSYPLAVMGLDIREYSFGPDGLQFSQKAELKLSRDLFTKTDGTPADEIFWLYLNPRTEGWELQNIIPCSPDGNFHIDLSHFSIYRAITRNGVGVSQGGQVKENSK